MNLVTPDAGLLFWMVVIFGIVFFLLAKFGFPIITGSVEKRNAKIEKSLKDADELEKRMAEWKQEQARMMAETRKEQSAILREASEERSRIISEARNEAREQSEKLVSEAKVQIAAEKESALRDIRKEVALLSVQVAEKVLRRELESDPARSAFVNKMVEEASQASLKS